MILQLMGFQQKLEQIIQKLSEFVWHHEGQPYGYFTGFLVEIDEEPRLMEPNKAKHLHFAPIDNLPEPIAPYTLQYLRDLNYKV